VSCTNCSSDVNLKIYLVSKPNFLTVLLDSYKISLEQSLKFIVDAGYFKYFSVVVEDGCILVSHFVAAIYGRVGQDASTKLCCIQLFPTVIYQELDRYLMVLTQLLAIHVSKY
jgi:hypothetical protein